MTVRQADRGGDNGVASVVHQDVVMLAESGLHVCELPA